MRFETFDTDALVRQLKAFDPNGVIVVYNYGGEIKIKHCPTSLPLKASYQFYRPGTWTANRWVKWTRLISIMTGIMISVLIRQRVKHFIMGGGDILSWIAQFFKFIGRIDKTTNLLEDWSLPNPMDSRFNRIKMRINDFLLTRMDTTVVQTVKESFDSRNQFYGGKTLKNTVLHEYIWAWFLERQTSLPVQVNRRDICFFGNVRADFGLEILFELLPELHREFGFRLKIIGPETALYKQFRQMASRLNLETLIDWEGFVSQQDLPKKLANCFCGINLYAIENNVSRLAFAGRVIVYMQHLLVPILTPWSGPAIKLIADHRLGVLCKPDKESIRQALREAFDRNAVYVQNIDHFFAHNPYRREIRDLVEMKSS